MIRIPYPPFLTVERELAGNTTPTDPRSQRIRASRKGRPCNELGLSAQGLSAACPHLCAPDAPCPRWAHHNPLRRGSGEHQGAEIIMPDNGFIEALNGLFQAAKRKARGYTRFATMRTVLFLIAANSTSPPSTSRP